MGNVCACPWGLLLVSSYFNSMFLTRREFAPAARAPDRKIRIRYRLPADKQANNFGDELMIME